ncbi:cytochrome c biogenesis protein [Waterburya agarophytonicola K14]|uniref:Cytochrome c biogenesis protein CcsB n=1 Tax=Waterburya agarophytonicola KI4 TaxID=2874699 RepID=A0A964FFW0_9CYAN|nr:cytochrome c biogenesis protein [Waterburya agarophytonicola]MCC0178270.1 cytochrome c biogenesis protein [Waterburya agarophytonicola KI4]
MNSSLTPKSLFRRFISILANLKLAIALLLAIAVISITGTVIEQAETLTFYQQNYPESPALYGFLTWKVIVAWGFNHVYSTWWYLSLLILFGSSLTACTFTRQLPALKAARKWKYYQKPKQFEKLALSAELERGSIKSLVDLLKQKKYKVWQQDNALYARKGIIGRIGPIVVHLGMLIVLVGGMWGIFTGFFAQEMIASGNTFKIQNIIESGPFSSPQIPDDWSVKVNRFWIDYTNNGDIDQFYSDLSVIDDGGAELKRETIYVNHPLRYDGVTLYQTNWSIAAVRVQLNNSPVFQIPVAKLDTLNAGNIWGTWIPTKPDMSSGVSMLIKDLQGTALIYNQQGELTSAIRISQSVEIDGIKIKLLDIIGSTGLQIKADPGVPIVYTGFALLMIGVVMSYFSHSQVWALEQNNSFYFGAKTNRAQVSFEREMLGVIEDLSARESTNIAEPSTSLV